ncbi:MAG: acyl--CoA ligase [Ruminococcus sp.]|nr:acyl--CoA ligase [Ruminococcus sp.]
MKTDNLQSANNDISADYDCSVYDYLCRKNQGFGDFPSLVYYGKTISYSRMLSIIDTMANILKSAGVKKGDVVVVSLPAIPEAVYLFYAINKIGAVFCGMDCRSSAEEIEVTVNTVHPKLCFIADFHFKEFRNCNSVPLVYIRSTETIGGFTRVGGVFADFFTGRMIQKLRMDNVYTYKEFISQYSGKVSSLTESVSGDDICAYFYTSGTTYGRKCVVLTNKNINSAVLQHSKAQVDIKRGNTFSNIMPLFTCYGITIGTHLPLCLGLKVNLVPLFNPKNMKKLITESGSSFIITVPAHWEYFIKDSFADCDLSYFKAAIVGGDRVEPEYENKIKSIMKKCGSEGRVLIGYGLTETASTAVTPPVETPMGSVGKAMSLTDVRIFSTETGEESACMEKGEICISGPSVCKGYLNDKEATDTLLRKHKDGKVWLHSGDIGYMDAEGYVFFCERIKRMYVRFDGTKVSPYSIEQVIKQCPVVSRCLVLAVKDTKHTHGKCAKAVIVLKNTQDVQSAKLICEKFITQNLPEFMRPEEVAFVDRLPVTKNGKVDYFAEN